MGQSFKELAILALKSAGARITKPRMAVIDCLEQTTEPLTAKEITDSILSNRQQIDMDPVTTYRILDRLRELGVVHQVARTGRYLPCTHVRCEEEYHLLLRCLDCHRVDEQHVPQKLLRPFFEYLQSTLQFQSEQDILQLDGHCESCLAEIKGKRVALESR